MVTASCAVPQSSLVTILKELAIAKQTNWQLRKNIQQMLPKQTPFVQSAITNPNKTLKAVTTNTSASGEKDRLICTYNYL